MMMEGRTMRDSIAMKAAESSTKRFGQGRSSKAENDEHELRPSTSSSSLAATAGTPQTLRPTPAT